MTEQKLTRRVSARTLSGIRFEAYEIHMGISTTRQEARPLLRQIEVVDQELWHQLGWCMIVGEAIGAGAAHAG